jgi:dolichol-phosphate mannosyltransferase
LTSNEPNTQMKCVIVIPTYNEAHNLPILIPKLYAEFKEAEGVSFSVLIVDDSSPDHTAQTAEKLKKWYKNLYLIEKKREGLGKAYVKGFEYCLKKLKSDIIFEMDADLSHPSRLIPFFLDEIEKGYDLVIGSRYIKGGSTPDWSISRKIISRLGNLYSRILLGVPVQDQTSGYRAIKVSFLKKINLRKINSRGYAFQNQLLYELYKKGAKIKEIPLVFRDRKHGESKLNEKDIKEFIVNTIKLRLNSRK